MHVFQIFFLNIILDNSRINHKNYGMKKKYEIIEKNERAVWRLSEAQLKAWKRARGAVQTLQREAQRFTNA